MKNCADCENLYPVTQCMKHEEYRAMLAQCAAEHPAPRSLASRLLSMFSPESRQHF